jgi:hypothetical protein
MEMENKGFTKIKTDTPYRYNIFTSLRLQKLLNAESEQTLSTSNSWHTNLVIYQQGNNSFLLPSFMLRPFLQNDKQKVISSEEQTRLNA